MSHSPREPRLTPKRAMLMSQTGRLHGQHRALLQIKKIFIYNFINIVVYIMCVYLYFVYKLKIA